MYKKTVSDTLIKDARLLVVEKKVYTFLTGGLEGETFLNSHFRRRS